MDDGYVRADPKFSTALSQGAAALLWRWRDPCYRKHMPEGPTIKVTADTLRHALRGKLIRSFSSRFKKSLAEGWQPKIEGQRVERVHAHGNNLFITFSSGYVLYTHMLMWGSWHVYQRDEPWAKEERKARVILQTDTHIAVLFSAPVCDLLHRNDLASHKTAEIGPDLLGDTFDLAEAFRRFQLPQHAGREVGELIMDQTVIAGIGNILKSEILFQAGIHPRRLAHTLTQAEFERMIEISRTLMQLSYQLGTFDGAFLPPDTPIEPHRYGYVYRRRTYPCLRCATPINVVRQGPRQRMSYYCPRCQPYVGDNNPDLAAPPATRRQTTRTRERQPK